MKVEELVARALRLIKVLDPNEAIEASDYETARFALNAMMARIEADGISVGWQDVDNPADELPLPPEAVEAIAYNLAIALADEYGQSITPSIATKAEQGLSSLYRDVLNANPIINRSSGPLPSNGWPYYNIRSDTY